MYWTLHTWCCTRIVWNVASILHRPLNLHYCLLLEVVSSIVESGLFEKQSDFCIAWSGGSLHEYEVYLFHRVTYRFSHFLFIAFNKQVVSLWIKDHSHTSSDPVRRDWSFVIVHKSIALIGSHKVKCFYRQIFVAVRGRWYFQRGRAG